jgi:methionyl-tRNA synthetase
MAEQRRIVATSGLPYANGHIHIGHLVEYLQTDFWTRFQKMRGHDCLYICGDDTHGTPILVRARQENKAPTEIIAQSWKEHTQDFQDFEIQFDNFGSTNSETNKKLVAEIFTDMKNKGHIAIKTIDQQYCPNDKMFLPDRFVKGTCPKCSSPDQYGDSCDKCSSTYNTTDLKDAKCALCGTTPIIKDSEHLLFKLNDFRDFLREWVPTHTNPEIAQKMKEWLDGDMREWDISRDEPYFGFEIPGYPNKYFYVWVDAPVGYIASTAEWCAKNNKKLEDYWQNKKTEIYHFIGKDITYFHTLFWPAMLSCSRFTLPKFIGVHGMLTVNGEKMSKSKGTSISARTYLNHLDPMYLRYYYASKLTSHADDLDLSLDDFTQRVNSDLIGKITNLGSRGAQMLGKKFDGVLTEPAADGMELIKLAQSKAEIIAGHYENRDYLKAINEIRSIADEANRYFDEKAPWKTIDTHPTETKAVVSTILYVFRLLSIYLKPILPKYVEKVEALYGEAPYNWFDCIKIPKGKKINEYVHLAVRVEKAKVEAMVEDTKQIYASKELEPKSADSVNKGSSNKSNTSKLGAANAKQAPAEANKQVPPGSASTGATAETSTIEIDDFAKVDLRIVKIIEAESVPEADKLIRLKVDLGDGTTKQIFAGIKSAYDPSTLVGRLTVIVANLKPRKMKFGMSEGMVLAAGAGGKDLFILSPDSGAKAGDKVK